MLPITFTHVYNTLYQPASGATIHKGTYKLAEINELIQQHFKEHITAHPQLILFNVPKLILYIAPANKFYLKIDAKGKVTSDTIIDNGDIQAIYKALLTDIGNVESCVIKSIQEPTKMKIPELQHADTIDALAAIVTDTHSSMYQKQLQTIASICIDSDYRAIIKVADETTRTKAIKVAFDKIEGILAELKHDLNRRNPVEVKAPTEQLFQHHLTGFGGQLWPLSKDLPPKADNYFRTTTISAWDTTGLMAEINLLKQQVAHCPDESKYVVVVHILRRMAQLFPQQIRKLHAMTPDIVVQYFSSETVEKIIADFT